MVVAMSLRCALIAVLFYSGASMRISGEIKEKDQDTICIGCKKYPEAPDYPDDMQDEDAVFGALDELQEELNTTLNTTFGGDSQSNFSVIGALAPIEKTWNYLMHAIFKALQGQQCMDLCALCIPSGEDLKEQMKNNSIKLKSVLMHRTKNWQDKALWPVLGPVDAVIGGVVDLLHGLPPAFIAFFTGGSVVGTAVGAIAGGSLSNSVGSLVGNLLGLVAGLSVGVLTGGLVAAAIEIVMLLKGFYKGIGIVSAVTDCKRFGFEFNYNGETEEAQPFRTQFGDANYGLKKLRKWMATDEAAVQEGDKEALMHCERVREHDFDMRHAAECVKHSQICGGTGVLIPVLNQDQCSSISHAPWLEDMAVALGDQQENIQNAFSAWRQLQAFVKENTNFDAKRAQCKKLMCQYGGLANAETLLNDKKLGGKISDAVKIQYKNLWSFMTACAVEYEIYYNEASERAEACADVVDGTDGED